MRFFLSDIRGEVTTACIEGRSTLLRALLRLFSFNCSFRSPFSLFCQFRPVSGDVSPGKAFRNGCEQMR
jgi:hypothetical protein